MIDDTVFEAMADGQRRQLLVGVWIHDTQRVPELTGRARELAAATDSFLDEYLDGSVEVEAVDKALVRTHLVHLPKLADYDFIEWRQDAHVVTRGPRFDELTPILELLDDVPADRVERETAVIQ